MTVDLKQFFAHWLANINRISRTDPNPVFTAGNRMARRHPPRDRSANKRNARHEHRPAGTKIARRAVEGRLTLR